MKKLFLQSGDACGICGGPCVVGSKGLYCPKCQPNKALNEVGIVAAGIPEPEQPEALAFLNEDDWTVPESGERPEITEEQWQKYIDEKSKEPQNSTNRDWYWYLRGLAEGYGQAEFEGHKRKDSRDNAYRIIEQFADNGEHSHWELMNSDGVVVWSEEAVSPPSQAESDIECWKEIYFDFQDGEGWILFMERMEKRFTLTRKTKP